MKVIKPNSMTDASVYSSSVSENEYAAYAAGTTYAVGQRCIYAHKIYECVQAPCLGKQPDTTPLFWAAISPTNKWAMFDAENSSQTAATGELTVVLTPGIANAVALFGLEGAALDITVRDGLAGAVVFTEHKVLDGTVVADWYQYFFEPYVQLGECVFVNIPPYSNAHITVSITGGGAVKCGALMVGTAYTLGDVRAGANASIIDFSRKETNAMGVTTLTRRAYSKRMSVNLLIDTPQINKIQRILADLRAVPCAWIGVDNAGFEPLTIFGFYRDFSIDIAYPTLSYCSLEIEGLI